MQGTLKQRMVKHGRDIADNWAKMEAYKRGCVTGCDLAAHAERALNAKDRARFHSSVLQEEKLARGGILQAEEVVAQTQQRVTWTDSMKNACLEACKNKFPEDKKGSHACSGGCDTFFQIIHE